MTLAIHHSLIVDEGAGTSTDYAGVCVLGGSGYFLAVRCDGQVYRSTNDGVSWSNVGSLTFDAGGVVNAVRLWSPQDLTDTAFFFWFNVANNNGAIFRTTDGGATWSAVYADPDGAFGVDYAAVSGGYTAAGIFRDGFGSGPDPRNVAFLVSADSGATWATDVAPNWISTTTYSLDDLAFYSASHYVSLQNANLNQPPSSSPTFWDVAQGRHQPNDFGTACSGLIQLESGRLLVGQYGTKALWYSDDASQTWTEITLPVGFTPIASNIDRWSFADMGDGVVLAVPNVNASSVVWILQSVDDGLTWTVISNPAASGSGRSGCDIVRIGDYSACIHYGYTNESVAFLQTEDNGATWTHCTSDAWPGPGQWRGAAQMAVKMAGATATIITVTGNADISNGHGTIWRGVATDIPIAPTYGMEIWRGMLADPCGTPDDPTGLPEQGTARRYATTDLDVGGVFFSRGITREPTVSKAMIDTLWGQIATENATFELFLDAILLQGYTQDQRGQQFALELYDRASGFRQTKLQGVTTNATISAGRMTLDGQNFDPSIFEQPLPRGRITTEEFPNAVDLGHVITKVFGDVAQVPCRYINDDVIGSTFDYLVARGVVSVPYVFRIGPSGSLMNVDPEEYVVSTTLYPCYTVLRFILRQVDVSNSLIPIFADVVGEAYERNVARAIQAFCSDTRWALGKTVDEDSFDTAAALLEPSTAGLQVDGALTEADQAQNWLAELFQFAGIRMRITSAGAIAIEVDTGQTGVRLHAEDGAGAATHTLLDVSRSKVKLQDATRRLVLRYRQDMRELQTFFFEQSRVVNADLGKTREYRNRFIRSHLVADVVTDRLAKRVFYAEDGVSAKLPQEGRGLEPGDLISLTYPILNLNADTYEVTRLSVARRGSDVTLAGWDASIFTYTPGTLPTESTGGGGRVDDPMPPPGGPPADENPAPTGPPEQPPGFPAFDWGSVGYRAWQYFLDYRGLNASYGAASTVLADSLIEVALPQHPNHNFFGARPGSIKIYDNPVLMTHPDTGKQYAIVQAGVSQRITDDSAGALVGDVGAGPNDIIYGIVPYVRVTFANNATTPIVILYSLDGVATPVL